MPAEQNSEREAFERYMTDGGRWPDAVRRGADGDYVLAQTAAAWSTWRAAWQARAAREDALVAALRELVRLKGLKGKIESRNVRDHGELLAAKREYDENKPRAWEAACAALRAAGDEQR